MEVLKLGIDFWHCYCLCHCPTLLLLTLFATPNKHTKKRINTYVSCNLGMQNAKRETMDSSFNLDLTSKKKNKKKTHKKHTHIENEKVGYKTHIHYILEMEVVQLFRLCQHILPPMYDF